MFFICLFSSFIDRHAPCVLFRLAMSTYQFAFMHCYLNIHIHQLTIIVIDVLVVVYDKMWENRVMLSLHGQVSLDILPRC